MSTRTHDPLVHSLLFDGRRVVGYSSESALYRLGSLVTEYGIRSVIEVGSYVGMSACFFAEMGLDVICVDPFDGRGTINPVGPHVVENQYAAFLVNTLPYPNIRHVRLTSTEAAAFPTLEADMIYLDADHTYESVRDDITAWRPHARRVLCGDDNLDDRFGVTQAVREAGIPNRSERIWWETRS